MQQIRQLGKRPGWKGSAAGAGDVTTDPIACGRVERELLRKRQREMARFGRQDDVANSRGADGPVRFCGTEVARDRIPLEGESGELLGRIGNIAQPLDHRPLP